MNGQTKQPPDTQQASSHPATNGQIRSTARMTKAPLQPKPAESSEALEKKVKGAELKKQKQAEKAARRAAEKGLQDAPSPPSTLTRKLSTDKASQKSSNPGASKHHKRTGSAAGKTIPIRQSGTQNLSKEAIVEAKPKKKVEEKRVAVFEHLYGQPRRNSIGGAGKEVHPAVLALGLQLRNYEICGSNARCVAMLLVFKRVI